MAEETHGEVKTLESDKCSPSGGISQTSSNLVVSGDMEAVAEVPKTSEIMGKKGSSSDDAAADSLHEDQIHPTKLRRDLTVPYTIEDVLHRDFLGCRNCRDVTNPPLLLPCLHTLCTNCIQDKDQCTICDHPLSGSGSGEAGEIEETSNVFIRGLRKLADCRQRTDQSCDYCRFEGKTAVGINRCVECGDSLCEECSDAHKKTKLTRNHTLITFKEIRSGAHDETIRACTRVPCPEHTDELAVKFCLTCNQLVCRECREGSHDSHHTQSQEEAGNRLQTDLTSRLKGVKDRLDRVDEYTGWLEDYRETVMSRGTTLAELVDRQAEELAGVLEGHRQRLLEAVRESIDGEVALVTGRVERLRVAAEEMSQSCEFVKALVQHGRPDEILATGKTIQKRFDELTSERLEGIRGKLAIDFQSGASTVANMELLFGRINTSHATLRANDPDTPSLPGASAAPTHSHLIPITNTPSISAVALQPQPPSSSHLDLDYLQGSGGDNRNPPLGSPRESSPVPPYSARSMGAFSTSTDALLSSRHLAPISSALQDILDPPNGPSPPRQSAYTPKSASHLPPLLNKAKLVFEFEARSHQDTCDIWPTGLGVNSLNGDIYILDRDNKTVKVFNANGNYKFEFGGSESGDGMLSSPFDLAISPSGSVFVTDYQFEQTFTHITNDVKMYDLRGNFVRAFDGGFKHPRGIAITSRGHFVVADCRLRQVTVHDPSSSTGRPVSVIRGSLPSGFGEIGDLFTDPYYVAVSPDDCIMVTDWAAPSLKIFDPEGAVITQTGYYGSGQEQLLQPYGVCIDKHGYVMVADNSNHRIHVAAPDGRFIRYLANKSDGLWHPMAVAVDASRGRVVVSEALGKIKVFQYMNSP